MQLPRRRKRPKLAPILRHVRIKPVPLIHLLQHTLRPRRWPQALQLGDRLDHGGERDPRRFHAEALVRPGAVVDIGVEVAAGVDGHGCGKDFGVARGVDVAHEDLVARFHGDGAAEARVVDCGRGGDFAVAAKGAVEADGFHGVVEDQVVRGRGALTREVLDLGPVFLAFWFGEVEVEDLGEDLGLVGDHCAGRAHDLLPGDVFGGHAAC